MEVIGHGPTYSAALADARAQMQAHRDMEMLGSAGGFVMALTVGALLAGIWALVWSIFRPVAGTFFAFIANLVLLAVLVCVGFFTGAFSQQGGGVSIVQILLSLLGLFGTIIFLGLRARMILTWFEYMEAKALYKLFEISHGVGKTVHAALYLYTASVPIFLFSLPLHFSTDSGSTYPSDAYAAQIGLGIAASIVAIAIRYKKHPFARHLTFLGDARGVRATS